jgi:hypothetical protein
MTQPQESLGVIQNGFEFLPAEKDGFWLARREYSHDNVRIAGRVTTGCTARTDPADLGAQARHRH